MEKQIVTISADIDAPIEKVWSYWNEPEHIMGWNFATDDWMCPRAENDLRPGGRYLARMEAKDGSFGFDFEALYDEVLQNKSISYTMGDGRRVTNEFTDHGGSTTILTKFEAEEMNPIELQQDGWQAILNNFKKYTESH